MHAIKHKLVKSIFIGILCCIQLGQLNAQTLKPFSIILDWFVNPTHGPILIAQEKGDFAKYGLKVNIITPADPADTAKMVALGKADIGIGSDPQLLILSNRDLPLLRAGALINQPLAALTSYDIKNLRNIRGKTVGYPVGGIDKIILSIMLRNVGLSLKDIKLVDVHYNLVQALLSKRVDAIAGAMRDYEVPQLRLQGLHVNTFYPENYGVPRYAELNYIINVKHRDDPRLTAFFNAIKDATAFIQKHPQLAWQLIVKTNPQLNTKLNHVSWNMTYALFPTRPSYTNKNTFMHLVSVLYHNGWLTHKKAYANYVR